jgi:hypothetical protein
VGGPVDVDIVLKGGETLDLGNGRSLKVIHTPGHSKGSIAIVYGEDGALFSGDSIPLKGAVPIYEDVLSSIKSIKKLKDIKGLKALFASWDQPQQGKRVYELMDEGLRYLQYIHDLVLKEKSSSPSASVKEISTRVLGTLGFPDAAQIPMVVKSIEGHLKVADRKDLLAA